MTKRWKPEKGVQYFLLDADGGIGSYVWEGDAVDRTLYELGNCFRTSEEVKVALKKVKDLLLGLHGEPAAECIKLPKLTADVFNHPDCPEWANYATVNKNGIANYYEEKPYVATTCFHCSNGRRWVLSGRFDASDWKNSLIERPAKALPDWCEVDAIGWHKRWGYFKIARIEDAARRVTVQQLENNYQLLFLSNTVCSDAIQARLRPYNADEMKALVGKLITMPDDSVALCTAWSSQNNGIVLDNMTWYPEDLVVGNFTIDGKPTGVLQRFENGEWTE